MVLALRSGVNADLWGFFFFGVFFFLFCFVFVFWFFVLVCLFVLFCFVLFCLFFVVFFNTFLTKQIQLSHLPCLEYFGLSVSVTFPVYRNVNDEKCLSLLSVSKGCASLL